MNKVTSLITGAACLAIAQVALADGLKSLPYTGVQLSYGKTDFDDIDVDADGFGITGFFDIGSNVFISGGYASAETDDFTVLGTTGSVKISGFSVGLGYHHPLNEMVDLVPSISLIDATTEFQGGFSGAPDEDDTGWAAGLTLRALATPHLELAGGFSYIDIYDDDDTSFQIEAHYYPVEKLSLGLTYNVSDDAKTLEFVARVLFGQ